MHSTDPESPSGSAAARLPPRGREFSAVLWSAAYHFFVLLSYSMLRPVRESMGIERGYEDLAWLMTGTLAVMFIANPIFATLVSKLPRRKFIPLTYRFFAISLLVFFGLFHFLPDARTGLGYGMYIWLSVFNLFVVSVFWAFMADIFNNQQGRRLFGYIAVGGTLGAIAGPALTGLLVSGISFGDAADQTQIKLQPQTMLVISVICLEFAVQCVRRLLRIAGVSESHTPAPLNPSLRRGAEPGPGALEGLRLIARSPYLMLLCAFMLVFTILSSLLYMEQGRIVAMTFTDRSSRTAAFAQIDIYTQSLTLILQLLITRWVIKWLGIGGALTIVPILTAIGFAVLMIDDSFTALATFMVLRRAFHYALDRPAREVLYTVVNADAKYKSKSFIDTFIYRGGDVIGGWSERLLAAMGMMVGFAAIPLAACGVVVAILLGRRHHQQADDAGASR